MLEVRHIGFLGIAVFSLVGISLAIASLVKVEWCAVNGTVQLNIGAFTYEVKSEFNFGLHEYCIKGEYAGQTQQQCFDPKYPPSMKKHIIDAVQILVICGLVVGFFGLCFLVLLAFLELSFLVVLSGASVKMLVITSAILLSAGGALVIAASLVYRFEAFIELENWIKEDILLLVFEQDEGSLTLGDFYLSRAFWLCVASSVFFVVAGILGFIVGKFSKTEKSPATPGTVITMPMHQYPNQYPNIAYISDTNTYRQTDNWNNGWANGQGVGRTEEQADGQKIDGLIFGRTDEREEPADGQKIDGLIFV